MTTMIGVIGRIANADVPDADVKNLQANVDIVAFLNAILATSKDGGDILDAGQLDRSHGWLLIVDLKDNAATVATLQTVTVNINHCFASSTGYRPIVK
jgi:hypothetical protein